MTYLLFLTVTNHLIKLKSKDIAPKMYHKKKSRLNEMSTERDLIYSLFAVWFKINIFTINNNSLSPAQVNKIFHAAKFL